MICLQILSELYTRVKGTKGSWRGAILGALYGLVECTSPKILLAVARVVLALGVTGSNLTGACKLVFKVARNEVGFCNSNWGTCFGSQIRFSDISEKESVKVSGLNLTE